MNYRKLGRAGIKVSEISIGGWLTHGRSIDDSETADIVQTAFDLGINFFDTADVYNQGEAEVSLGKAIAHLRRDDLFIATKCFFPMSERPNDRGLSRKHIFESVHNSLKRLRTDYIDLMQFHRFDSETPLDETVRAIDDLVRQGKVFYWGVSEWQAHQIADVVRVAESCGANPPSSNQPRYSLLARGIEEAILPTCETYGMGSVVFSPLAQGILTGKYVPGEGAPAGSRGADEKSNMFMRGQLTDEALLTRVQELKSFVSELGVTMPQFALGWCLRRPGISSVITGASNVEQVTNNASASGVTFEPDVWTKAEAIVAGSAH